MLTKTEALELAECCDAWPGGLGCILIPSEQSKREWKAAPWGFKGRIPVNFDYQAIPSLEAEYKTLKLCPVTIIGIRRGALDYRDHNAAYREIIASLKCVLPWNDEKAIRVEYNRLLSREPRTLASHFRKYAETHS